MSFDDLLLAARLAEIDRDRAAAAAPPASSAAASGASWAAERGGRPRPVPILPPRQRPVGDPPDPRTEDPMPARALLERLYGFAAPVAGGAGLACVYCDAPARPDGGPAPHAADCPYWDARVAFDAPVARRLVARLAGGGA